MATPRVYADFHNLDDENRVRLTCAGTSRDLERHGITLREGMALAIYTDDADDIGTRDDLLAEGIVHYDEGERCWVVSIDWQAIRHASETLDANPNGLGGQSAGAALTTPSDAAKS